ncbi:MAG TPA: antibiotic biosynthesis monooxygenase family protein [Candidatus Dormibacteraeota bacterium]|nr:antibiotic biosynthesis monooxygenase family protein [Candidatus Dormibacteraeota bacterium]
MPDAPSEQLALMVTWLVRPGEENKVEAILRTMVPKTRAEPGCIAYTVQRSVEEPRLFMIYELYRDEAALKAHEASEYFRHHVLEEGLPLLERRVRSFYRPL